MAAKILRFLRRVYHGLTLRRYWLVLGLSTLAHVIFTFVGNTASGIDSHIYLRVAHQIQDAGSWPACGALEGSYWPPLYPLLLAQFFRLFGEASQLYYLLNIAALVLITVISERYMRRLVGELSSRWAGLFVFNSMLMYYFTMYYKYELITCLLVALSLYFLFRDSNRPLIALSLAGVFLGLAALATGRVLALLPGMVYLVAMTHRPRAVKYSVILLLATSAAIGPWTVRNWICHDRLILLSTNAGFNFYSGFNEVANGTYQEPELFEPPYDTLSLRNQSAFLQGGLDYICRNPGRSIMLTLSKTNLLWRVHYADSALFYPFFWIGIFILPRLLGSGLQRQARSIQLMIAGYTVFHMLFIARYYYLVPLLPLIYAVAVATQHRLGRSLLSRYGTH